MINTARANAALRSHIASAPGAPSADGLFYAAAVGEEVVVGYGIDHKGPWARVGDARARARTPEAALAAALAKHREAK